MSRKLPVIGLSLFAASLIFFVAPGEPLRSQDDIQRTFVTNFPQTQQVAGTVSIAPALGMLSGWRASAGRETLTVYAGRGSGGLGAMGRFLVHWFSTALALLVCSRILPGVHVDSYSTLAVAALVLGFMNAIIRPILLFLTLPITLLTLGLFYFVVNGLAFALAAWIVPGFDVDSILWAILGSIIVSVVSWFLGSFGRQQPLPLPRR